jgi:hypothetical protein
MSADGKKILQGIIILPLFATFGALVVFGGSDILGDTLVFVFGTNLLPMLIGGFFAGLLIRSFNKSGGTAANTRWVALAPMLLPFAFGILWYLIGIFRAGAGDAGREFFSGPLYLVILALGVGIISSIVYVIMPKGAATS